MRWTCLFVLVLVAACGGEVFPAPTTDGGPAADAAAETATDAPAVCRYGPPTTLAGQKSCVDSKECVFVTIKKTCCLDVAYGVNATFKDSVTHEVASRTASCPGCGCLAQPQDETGKQGGDFIVSCDQGKCTAHVK